jgi:replicative DNA helicase
MNIIPQKWDPVDISSEQAVLGSIMVSPETFAKVSTVLEAEHFFDDIHRQIYQIVSTLTEHGKLVSVLTVPAFLPPMIGETGVKTKVYMARLAAESVPPDIALGYAKHVREIALRRRIAEISIQMAPDAATDAAQLAAEAIDALDTIVASSASWALPAASMAQVMGRAVDKVAAAYANDSKIIGIPTGLRDLDHKMGGLQPETLVVLAGRPGMGKSAVLLNLMRQSAMKGYRSLCFSKEMSAEELGERMISDYIFDIPSITRMPYTNLRNGSFHENMFQYVKEAALEMGKLPIDVEEQPGLTMSPDHHPRAPLQAQARAARHPGDRPLGPDQAVGTLPGQQGLRAGRDHRGLQGAGQGDEVLHRAALAVVARGREARGQAADSLGLEVVGFDRAGR